MTRKDFFRCLFPLRDRAPQPEKQASPAGSAGDGAMREVFLEAMRQGIDPATVDPRRLLRIVARDDHDHPTRDDKRASGPDLAGHPDALRRPQQRGGPDGDKRRTVFLS